ncbi:hypothetical protein LEL_09386 [Akanthomyces lecanii RCEF 1005]|uniref:Uncharacterized protein n=1 Tax=Akanthomyces lecanii RCEF 1005 TaxID=1081108 RepID=A0A168C0X3_CORDF|nr:hypothetical protein LEL_09386 [Akanthomyces lecanii RCEF 1005]
MKLTLALSAVLQLATLAAANKAVDAIKIIAPGSVSCPPSEAAECRTADQAATPLIKAMAAYKLETANEIAAVLALMAFESVDFRYKHNVYPGRPGQGTANMQMANYNLLYAKSLDGVKEKVADVESVDGLAPDKLNYILSLVQPDEHNFASGPWFLTTQCPKAVRDALQKNIDAGFAAYMACVGVSVTPERQAYLTRAKKAFGIK